MAKIARVGKARLPLGYNSTSYAQMTRKRSFGVSIRINGLRYFRGTFYTNLGRASYRAMKEYGRIIKSDFVLTYYDDMELRQRIEMQLNKVEQANKFSAAVFFDNDHSFQDGELDQQKIASMCKLLLQNAIILWNYLSLSDKLVNTQDVDERQEAIEAIRRGSVLTWSHVNMRGEYTFTPPSANDDVFNLRKIRALQIMKQ